MELKVFRTRVTKLPTYAHELDSGMDLYAAMPTVINPGCREIIPTGIIIELPIGTEGQIRSKSGIAYRHGVSVLNAPGTIDRGYNGEVCVILVNHGEDPYVINAGDKIAQLVVCPVLSVCITEVQSQEDMDNTSLRGSGGFGSTGI